MLSLAGGLAEASTFPRELLAEAAQRQLRTGDVLQYSTTEGEERLRRHVARYESVRQQREVDALDVVITTGSQQALAMLASIVADVGHAIAVPHPCYLGALQTFGAAGLHCHPVDIIDGELDLDRLDVQLQSGLQIQAMYVVANHGNPDGSRLDEAKNRRLAALADRWGFWLIEDDPYRELWFDTPPAPSLAAYTANAVSLGSFSKSIAPGLRVGWLVASGDLFAAVVRAKQSLDLHTSTLSQVLVAELLDEPDWCGPYRHASFAVCVTSQCIGGRADLDVREADFVHRADRRRAGRRVRCGWRTTAMLASPQLRHDRRSSAR